MTDRPPLQQEGAPHAPTYKELLKWLSEAADPHCRDCDGSGIFYGNVHICGCINTHQYDPPPDGDF